MCFSASASFIASGGLVVLGGASLVVAKKEDKILAAIPLLFGLQQFFEGIQWLAMGRGSSSLFAGHAFLFFALVLWPIYVPIAVYLLDKKRQNILRWFAVLGAIVGLYFLWVLMTQTLSIGRYGACINYNFYSPLGYLMNIPYLLAIFAPLFISHHHIFKWFGVAVVILASVAWFFYAVTFTSVWCFFSAVVSSMFFLYIKSKHRRIH